MTIKDDKDWDAYRGRMFDAWERRQKQVAIDSPEQAQARARIIAELPVYRGYDSLAPNENTDAPDGARSEPSTDASPTPGMNDPKEGIL